MIILDATTKSLQLKLSGAVTANQLPFSASYVDTTGTATTPGEQDGTSNSTTAVTLVGSPAASAQRLVKGLAIQNADTAAATVEIIYNNNSTLRNIIVATLAAGDQLIYEDGSGWSCLDSNGNLKTSGSGGGTPGGSNGQVQYNNSGVFGGLANGQLPGTATNDNASSGNVGEYISSYIHSGSPTSIAANTATNLTSISLPAGDWDVYTQTAFISPSGKTISLVYSSASTTSATLQLDDFGFNSWMTPGITGDGSTSISAGGASKRLSLSTTTTVYLVVQHNASGSTSFYGGLFARRRR